MIKSVCMLLCTLAYQFGNWLGGLEISEPNWLRACAHPCISALLMASLPLLRPSTLCTHPSALKLCILLIVPMLPPILIVLEWLDCLCTFIYVSLFAFLNQFPSLEMIGQKMKIDKTHHHYKASIGTKAHTQKTIRPPYSILGGSKIQVK